MNEIRNVLLIGRTGQGKSSLANVLVNKNGSFEEVFKEDACSISETKDVQAEVFEHKGIKYQIVDTIGLDDKSKILDVEGTEGKKLKQAIGIVFKACKKVENGLHQVFFVIGDKFAREDIETYKILRKVLFDEGVAQYTTIVRTKFDSFKSEKKCKEDIERSINEGGEEIAEMVKSCSKIVIHVNNPTMSISGDDDDSDDEEQISLNKKSREKSRKILLEHLENCQEAYKPEILGEINKKVDNFAWEEIEALKGILRKKIEESRKEENLEKKQSIEEEINVIKEEMYKKEELLQQTIFNSFFRFWNNKVQVPVIQNCRIM